MEFLQNVFRRSEGVLDPEDPGPGGFSFILGSRDSQSGST